MEPAVHQLDPKNPKKDTARAEGSTQPLVLGSPTPTWARSSLPRRVRAQSGRAWRIYGAGKPARCGAGCWQPARAHAGCRGTRARPLHKVAAGLSGGGVALPQGTQRDRGWPRCQGGRRRPRRKGRVSWEQEQLLKSLLRLGSGVPPAGTNAAHVGRGRRGREGSRPAPVSPCLSATAPRRGTPKIWGWLRWDRARSQPLWGGSRAMQPRSALLRAGQKLLGAAGGREEHGHGARL